MSDDYFSYTEQLVPAADLPAAKHKNAARSSAAAGRRVFALTKACELAGDRTPAAAILATAQAFEAWLMDAAPPKGRPESPGAGKPKIAAVKTG